MTVVTTTPQHVVNGRDRPIEFGPWPEVGGGQIWTQTAFPCFSRFVVYLGGGMDGKWVLVHNPMHGQGHIAIQWRGPPWEQYFTTEQLQTFFHENHYHCEGQLYDLILSHWYDALCQDPPDNG